MSDQQSSTQTPAKPILCKLGCGFFGSNSTGDYCSKCWHELQAREGNTPAAPVSNPVEVKPTEAAPSAPVAPIVKQTIPIEAASPVKNTTKKKKKKTSYKSMMAAMTQGNKDHDIEKEKESLRKVTGGGTFAKIDKI